jgi:hypothetical protein
VAGGAGRVGQRSAGGKPCHVIRPVRRSEFEWCIVCLHLPLCPRWPGDLTNARWPVPCDSRTHVDKQLVMGRGDTWSRYTSFACTVVTLKRHSCHPFVCCRWGRKSHWEYDAS